MSAFRNRREMTAAISELGPPNPATDPTEQAIRTVARRVLAAAVAEFPIPPEWGNYPEIAEDDWSQVVARVRELAERGDVQTEHYDAAYRHLTGRADGGPE